MKIEKQTPRQIVEELDKYIIAQKEAKKSVAIALRNRWRRQQVPDDLREEIMPNNIILIGPTGVGKTEISRRLARLAAAPFIKVEASKFTEIGYVGRDVESMIRDLVEISVGMVKDEKTETVRERAESLAEDRLLDLLIPPIQSKKENVITSSIDENVEEQRLRTRAKMKELLESGKLEDRIIELDVPADSSPVMQIFGPIGIEEMGIKIQDILGPTMPRKTKKRKKSVKEAREYLIQEEANRLIDMEDVIQEAINRVEQSGIVFIDEIDKITGSQGASGPDVSREGVQRDILPVVEGTTVVTKHGMIKTDHILFIAAGAFHVSKPSDLIPELQGRFPIRVELRSLTADDFVRILTEPKNALIKQYTALLETEDVVITFTDEAIREIAEIASKVNERGENIGARRLHTVMTTLLEDFLFGVPDEEYEIIKVTKKMVEEKLGSIASDKDLTRYIL